MMNNFYQAMVQANLLYGVELNFDDFAEVGLNAWNFIGNKQTRLYRYRAKIDPTDLSINLPCNADIIEAVTLDEEDWNYSTNIDSFGDINSFNIESDIEQYKYNTNILYQNGRFVNYEKAGNTLYFDRNYGTVNILYRGIMLDEDGLPELSDKEVIAIATYVAYVQKFKQGLITNNVAITNMANLLKADWLKYCDAARVPTHISQNDMNEILEAKASWDRKMYNKSYHPLK